MLLFTASNLALLLGFISFSFSAGNSQSLNCDLNQVQATSEGSDCRCKCILTTENGEACPNNPAKHKIIYSVNTVTSGEDCRCACQAPPPQDACKEKIRSDTISSPNEIKIPFLRNANGNTATLLLSDSLFRELDEVEQPFDVSHTLRQALDVIIAIKTYSITSRLQNALEDLDDVLKQNYSSVISTLHKLRGEIKKENDTSGDKTKSTTAHVIVDSTTPAADDVQLGDENNTSANQQAREITTQNQLSAYVHETATTQKTIEYDNERISSATEIEDNKEEQGHVSLVSSTTSSTTTRSTLKFQPPSSASTTTKSLAGSYELYRREQNKNDDQVVNKKDRDYYDDYYNTQDNVERPPVVKMNTTFAAPSTSTPSTTTSTTPTTLKTTSNDDDDYYDDYYDYDIEQESTESTTTTTTTTQTTTEDQSGVSLDDCGTLFNLSQPRMIHSFGRREGAWMRDFMGKPKNRKKIYVTNYFYGNSLIEFSSVKSLKKFRWRRTHRLPYNYIGTGHIVYNGSFYYNRAFSKNIIKYDLKFRFVTSWGYMKNAIYDTATPYTWKGHSQVQLAADRDGLYVIYPAYNDFAFYPESDGFIINKMSPSDLRTLRTWRISLRRSTVSHLFIVCGVVYVTDRYDRRTGRLTHAYDTYTGVKTSLFLPFTNRYSRNVQMLYDSSRKQIMSWDDGHQMIYDVNLTR